VEISAEIHKKLIDKDKNTQVYFYKLCFSLMMSISIKYKMNRNDAKSLVNDSFIKILQNIKKYSIKEPLKPWVARITTNTAIDDYRKNKKHRENLSKTEIHENSFKTYTELDTNINLEDLLKKIDSILPKSTKLVFYLKNIDGLSHKEISKKLEITIETSKWHIKKANRLLKLKKSILIN